MRKSVGLNYITRIYRIH